MTKGSSAERLISNWRKEKKFGSDEYVDERIDGMLGVPVLVKVVSLRVPG